MMKQHDRVIGPGGKDLVHVEPDGLNGTKGNMRVTTADSAIMQPVEIQGHLSQTIQTHNAVSVPLSGNSIAPTNWIDCGGFDQIAVTLLNDAATASKVSILWSHDNATTHGVDWDILLSGTTQQRVIRTGVKARYMKVRLDNADTAAAHVMSAWAYLLA